MPEEPSESSPEPVELWQEILPPKSVFPDHLRPLHHFPAWQSTEHFSSMLKDYVERWELSTLDQLYRNLRERLDDPSLQEELTRLTTLDREFLYNLVAKVAHSTLTDEQRKRLAVAITGKPVA